MVQLQKNLEAITATGTQVVGVSYDSVEVLKKFADQSGVKFLLLADQGSKVIRAFGIHYQKGLPQPRTYVIGADRKVLALIGRDGYRDRHSAEELLEKIQEVTR